MASIRATRPAPSAHSRPGSSAASTSARSTAASSSTTSPSGSTAKPCATAGYRDAKLRTLLQTAEEVLGPGGEAGGLRVVDDLGVEHRGPALLLASNNPYAPRRPGARGVRPALDGGRLGIVVVDSPAPRTPPRARAWTVPALVVDGDREIVHAGLDGESVDLRMPLRIAVRPGALRVRVLAPRSRSVRDAGSPRPARAS